MFVIAAYVIYLIKLGWPIKVYQTMKERSGKQDNCQ